MAQVTARIVVSQAANPAPGGYSSGSRDNLNLNALITLTNGSNTGATSWTWEVFPAVGLVEGDYGVAGKESATCTLTPPASTGYGDLAVRLTVRGDPLPGGRPNVAVDEVLLGVRAPLSGYSDGLPIPHPHEATLGGRPVLSAIRGALGRFAEAIRALKAAASGGASLPAATTPGEMAAYDGADWISTGAPSNPTQILFWRDASGTVAWGDPSFEAGIDASGYLGQAVGGGFALSASSYSVAGSGALAMSASALTAHTVRLTGALTGNRVCTLPAGSGQEHVLINATTGTYTLQLVGPSGGSCYLAPGQSKRLSVDDAGILRGEGLRVWEFETTVSNIRGSAGPTDTVLCAVPAGLRLSCTPRLYQITGASIGSGAPTVQIGTSTGGSDIMGATGASSSSDTIVAPVAGSGIDADGGYPLAAGTLSLRNTTPGAVVAGTMRVLIVGLVLA